MENEDRSKADERAMRAALRQAARAAALDEVPVGAVITDEAGRIISRGHNQPIGKNDPTAHAEIEAIRKAARKRRNYRLNGCTIYVTVEPCYMCLAAIIQARLKRLVYGTEGPKSGATGSLTAFPFGKMNHRLNISAGVLGGECREIIRRFFSEKRRRKISKPAKI